MKDWVNFSKDFFDSYIKSFNGLSEDQKKNFDIKKEHSIRVSNLAEWLSETLKLSEQDKKTAVLIGLFHDIGRFSQLIEFNTFNDSKSIDHAARSVQILKEEGIFKQLAVDEKIALGAIEAHNKFKLSNGFSDQSLLHACLLRDADKLDILRVLSDYYSNKNAEPNHTLTWELPVGTKVSEGVVKEILSGRLVSKKGVLSQIDVKIMQLSWVYDFNFRPSFEYLLNKRYLEKIYNSLPKNDLNIDIYRKVKVFTENKLMG